MPAKRVIHRVVRVRSLASRAMRGYVPPSEESTGTGGAPRDVHLLNHRGQVADVAALSLLDGWTSMRHSRSEEHHPCGRFKDVRNPSCDIDPSRPGCGRRNRVGQIFLTCHGQTTYCACTVHTYSCHLDMPGAAGCPLRLEPNRLGGRASIPIPRRSMSYCPVVSLSHEMRVAEQTHAANATAITHLPSNCFAPVSTPSHRPRFVRRT